MNSMKIIVCIAISITTCSSNLFESIIPGSNCSDYCFNKTFPVFDGPINQQLVIAPMSACAMDVKFLLFTCKNKDVSQNFTYLSPSSAWNNSNFNKSVKTRFIVHGWNDQYSSNGWMGDMKNMILNKSCSNNVVAIDWSEAARNPYYFLSAYNTQIVGRMMGCVINRLKADLKLDPQNVDLYGHSLGGQVVGFAGKTVLTPKVRLIMGADPAAPGFQGYDDKYHIAYTDGEFVLIMHTNGISDWQVPVIQGFGDITTLGNIDFYVNGGSEQPGCSRSEALETLLTSIVTNPYFQISESDIEDVLTTLCSHVRTNLYAIADQSYVYTKCQLIGYNCSSYEDFSQGKCADCGDNEKGCRPMHYSLDYWDDNSYLDSTAIHLKYYLNTGDVTTSVYCLFHYQINLIASSNSTGCSGDVTITLSNGKQIVVTLGTDNSIKQSDGTTSYTKLYTNSQELGSVTSANITSTASQKCIVSKIKINYMSNIDEDTRLSMSLILCSTDGKKFYTNC